jgi:RNA polymerase sigma-70 factor, ECF subfamily
LLNADADTHVPGPEIETLVSRARAGDREAFGCLYDIYADRIYRHIYYRTAKEEDARDMTQEVFARAWQSLPKYKPTSTPFLGWLYTISHNRVIDYYRTRKEHSYLDIDVPSEARGPEQLAEATFARRDVRRAILLLPQDQQRVVLLAFIEGMEYREVAAALGKTEGNIRVIVHRALKRMREILGGER